MLLQWHITDQDHQKKEGYKKMENTLINQNWKDLIKPNKLNIKSNEDKSLTTVVAEPLRKRLCFNNR